MGKLKGFFSPFPHLQKIADGPDFFQGRDKLRETEWWADFFPAHLHPTEM